VVYGVKETLYIKVYNPVVAVAIILMLNKNRKIINNLPFIRKIFFNDKERLFAFSLPLNERFSNTKAN